MNKEFINIYNNLVNLSRNKNIYYSFTNKDTFSDRLLIFLFHLAFFFKNYKSKIDQKYIQNFYDYTFRQIELDIREIGYGDQSVNKKMKTYINMLYSIIEKINNWENYDKDDKLKIFNLYIENKDNNQKIVDYFEKYYIYLTKISLNSFIKSVIDHKF
ncbi:ubiquinol-cytochrome C reductase [Candidatus Pelagibacter sp.]|nr:ubiquinol-cytochrome C reductase [Candidatus Pelagibacter sp.]